MIDRIVRELRAGSTVVAECGAGRRGIVSTVTENFIRIDWSGGPRAYDVLSKASPLWKDIGAPE